MEEAEGKLFLICTVVAAVNLKSISCDSYGKKQSHICRASVKRHSLLSHRDRSQSYILQLYFIELM